MQFNVGQYVFVFIFQHHYGMDPKMASRAKKSETICLSLESRKTLRMH